MSEFSGLSVIRSQSWKKPEKINLKRKLRLGDHTSKSSTGIKFSGPQAMMLSAIDQASPYSSSYDISAL